MNTEDRAAFMLGCQLWAILANRALWQLTGRTLWEWDELNYQRMMANALDGAQALIAPQA